MGQTMVYGTAGKGDATSNCVLTAFRKGFRRFDTASLPGVYDEGRVGTALKEAMETGDVPRTQVWLQTAFAPGAYNPNQPLHFQVLHSVESSFQKLRVNYFDALFLFAPLLHYEDLLCAWSELEKYVDSGKVQYLGLGNHYDLPTIEKLYRHARVKPAIIQNRFYTTTGFDHSIRAFCASNGICYQGVWVLTANDVALKSEEVSNICQEVNNWMQGIGDKSEDHKEPKGTSCFHSNEKTENGGGLPDLSQFPLFTPQTLMYAFAISLGVVPLNGSANEAHLASDIVIASTMNEASNIFMWMGSDGADLRTRFASCLGVTLFDTT
eukprot:Selendium_serpulae@DN5867_c1_g1_i1.p1